jgi:ArsR family transcriptional regulator
MIDAAQFFKCLSDDTRLYATLLIHQEGELCVCELMEALDDSQPKISRHLAQLRNCGILDDERRSQWVFYSLSKTLPTWMHDVLQSATAGNAGTLNHFKKKLKAMKNRPQCC